jgi:hypothetical protein
VKRPTHLHDLKARELRRVERLLKTQLALWSRLEDHYPEAHDEIVADSDALSLVMLAVMDEARRREQDEADAKYLKLTEDQP